MILEENKAILLKLPYGCLNYNKGPNPLRLTVDHFNSVVCVVYELNYKKKTFSQKSIFLLLLNLLDVFHLLDSLL